MAAPEDALGGKICALASRAYERDYLGTAAALERYTLERLISFAARLDPGLEGEDFADDQAAADLALRDHLGCYRVAANTAAAGIVGIASHLALPGQWTRRRLRRPSPAWRCQDQITSAAEGGHTERPGQHAPALAERPLKRSLTVG